MTAARGHGSDALGPFLGLSLLLHAAVALLWLDATRSTPSGVHEVPRARVRIARVAPPAPPEVSKPREAVPEPPPRPVERATRRAVPPPPPEEIREPEAEPAPQKPTAPMPSEATVEESPAEPATAGLPAVAALPPDLDDLLLAYKQELFRRIAAEKRYPPMARRRGIEGGVTLRLAIGSDGALTALETLGHPHRILSKEAHGAVERAGPFPPPPGGALRIDFTLNYELDG